MRSPLFQKFAGALAIGAGAGGIAYAIAFLVFLYNGSRGSKGAIALLLLLGGLATSAVLVALYDFVREVDPMFALWGLIIGVAGAIGSVLHGGLDLAETIREIHPRDVSPVDARGLATFGLTSLGIITLSWLMMRDRRFPIGLGRLGIAAAAGLILVYVGRISLYNPKRPVLLALLVIAGFILTPAWYIWVGLRLRSTQPADARG
ncbi:MAG TPA: hypothetical protein VGK05_00135 [Acidimicrobiia bacterium]|jgi:hypothetical protein